MKTAHGDGERDKTAHRIPWKRPGSRRPGEEKGATGLAGGPGAPHRTGRPLGYLRVVDWLGWVFTLLCSHTLCGFFPQKLKAPPDFSLGVQPSGSDNPAPHYSQKDKKYVEQSQTQMTFRTALARSVNTQKAGIHLSQILRGLFVTQQQLTVNQPNHTVLKTRKLRPQEV